jgi:hypothetical protein
MPAERRAVCSCISTDNAVELIRRSSYPEAAMEPRHAVFILTLTRHPGRMGIFSAVKRNGELKMILKITDGSADIPIKRMICDVRYSFLTVESNA